MKKVENKSYKAKTERECGYVQWYDSTPGSHCCLLLDPYHDPSATATREIMVGSNPFCLGTSLPDLKPKSTSTSISIPMQNVMNKPVTEQDSLLPHMRQRPEKAGGAASAEAVPAIGLPVKRSPERKTVSSAVPEATSGAAQVQRREQRQ